MKPTCYVCERTIKGTPVYIPGRGEEEHKDRHERCAPGSKRWMESKIGKKSEFRKYFVAR